MKGREFLAVSLQLLAGATEAHWRSAAGRAYFALLIEARETLDRWGFRLPARDKVHAFVRLRFTYSSDIDLKEIGLALDELSQLRNRADYEMVSPRFATVRASRGGVLRVQKALLLLDAVDADSTRRTAAIADMRARWP